MALIQLDQISLEFGEQRILDNASFTIDEGERVCLIGRNGAGKSTLLNIITREILPDGGDIINNPDLRISSLRQTLPTELDQTVNEYVRGGLAVLVANIEKYNQKLMLKQDKAVTRELEVLQHLIEEGGGWKIDNQVETMLTELGLPGDRKLKELSGGWQRRVSLGRALISQPELLLLDEPTNHLDLGAIQWLEDRCFGFQGSVLFITHDRAFIQRLATRILELDRGRLRSWPGSYRKYLADKEHLLQQEAKHNALFDKRLDQEETWIRKGVKARRTRNEGRVRALEEMREVHAQRIKPLDKPRIHIEEGELSGRKIIEMRNIDYGYGETMLINKLSLKIQRGDRIGLIGNNGVGKSTLLKLILGEIQPLSGSIKQGTNQQIGYFGQMRKQELDPDKTVMEIIGDGSEYIKINGKDRHVIGYLKGFLFSPKRAMTPVRVLSGGECNRIILARMFTRPSNLLILDEPTNDLDVETMEVLEEQLLEFSGTLIVVSHDREFLDNVVSSTLVFEAGGKIQRYAGSYSDWLEQGKLLQEEDNLDQSSTEADIAVDPVPKKGKQNKLSYKFQFELDQLPGRIDDVKQQIDRLQEQTRAAEFYNQAYEKIRIVLDAITESEQELEQLMQRWVELEDMKTGMKLQ